MSSSEKLKVLSEAMKIFNPGNGIGPSKFQTGSEATVTLHNVLPQIVAVVEAAEQAEQKLWREYRRSSMQFDPRDNLPAEESWHEGEILADALTELDASLP